MLGRLGHDIVVFHLWRGQVQLVGGLDVRDLLEQIHQFRQIEKLGEAGPRPVAGPFRGKLQSGHCLPEAAGPAVKVRHAQFLQPVILEIPLHGVKLRHRVGNRRAGGKDDTPAAGDLIHVAAFGEHIAGFLRVSGGEARHIAHFCVQKQIFIIVRFIDKEPIYAQLLKSYYIIFAALSLQLFQPSLQGFSGSFQLLDGKPFSAAGFHLGNTVSDFLNLLPQKPLLALPADGDALKLRVSHDDSIVVSGGDPGAELLAPVGLEVLFGCHQNIGGRIKP